MAISDEARHQLHNKLDVVLGREEAATLMAHLPPVGWTDVATKHDLDSLSARFDLRFEAMSWRFSAVERKLDEHDRRFDRLDDELKQIRRELQSNLAVSLATSAAMLGAVVAAIRL